jgi:hypothetical protein
MPDDVLAELARILRKKKAVGNNAMISVVPSKKDLSQTSGNKAVPCGGLTIAVHLDQGGSPGCQGGPFLIKFGNPARKIAPPLEGRAWSIERRLPKAPTK